VIPIPWIGFRATCRFVVAELGTDADPFMLHLHAAVAEKQRALFSRHTREALKAAKASGIALCNAQLADVRARAIASTKAEADRFANCHFLVCATHILVL
jgi:DNA invertase Pin-like site-specific DNA recombinase